MRRAWLTLQPNRLYSVITKSLAPVCEPISHHKCIEVGMLIAKHLSCLRGIWKRKQSRHAGGSGSVCSGTGNLGLTVAVHGRSSGIPRIAIFFVFGLSLQPHDILVRNFPPEMPFLSAL